MCSGLNCHASDQQYYFSKFIYNYEFSVRPVLDARDCKKPPIGESVTFLTPGSGSVNPCSEQLASKWKAIPGTPMREDVLKTINDEKKVHSCFFTFPRKPEGIDDTYFATCTHVNKVRSCFAMECSKTVSSWDQEQMIDVFVAGSVAEPCAVVDTTDLSIIQAVIDSILSKLDENMAVVLGVIADILQISENTINFGKFILAYIVIYLKNK